MTSCDKYDFTKKSLHINCVDVGGKKYWLEMPLNVDAMNNIYFTISDAGRLVTAQDCESLTESECKENSSICKWEPGIFGVGGKCKAK